MTANDNNTAALPDSLDVKWTPSQVLELKYRLEAQALLTIGNAQLAIKRCTAEDVVHRMNEHLEGVNVAFAQLKLLEKWTKFDGWLSIVGFDQYLRNLLTEVDLVDATTLDLYTIKAAQALLRALPAFED